MANINFEFFLGNLSFVILFLIMIFYWVQALFSIIPKFNFLILFSTISANVSLFSILIIRWFNYGHFPLSNLYESLLFLSWSFTLIQLIFITSLKYSNLKVTNSNIVNYTILIGVVLSPIALFTNSFATFSLPKTMQKAQALVPALQSNWLMMHVTVMMLSYTALLCGSLLAITFLIITWRSFQKPYFDLKQGNSDSENLALPVTNDNLSLLNVERKKITKSDQTNQVSNENFIQNNSQTTSPSFTVAFVDENSKRGTSNIVTPSSLLDSFLDNDFLAVASIALPIKKQTFFISKGQRKKQRKKQNQELEVSTLAKTLDNLSYRIIGIGFPLLTIGILSGAVWANEAWGSYWSWDPKETWAFITWLIFAIYLHTRITKGWEGKKPAIIASCGFFIVWICYLGVNILGTGLHSYGWIKFGT